jgi:hypothetical protein
MRRLLSTTALVFLSSVAMAEQCTLSREEVSGENKLCFYKCLRGDQVLTIRAMSQCPLIKEFSSSLLVEPLFYAEENVFLVIHQPNHSFQRTAFGSR